MKNYGIRAAFAVSIWFIGSLLGCDVMKQLSVSQDASGDSSYTEAGGFAPRSFKLLSPAHGATGVSVTPTLSWEQAVDPEGKRISYTVLLTPAEGGTGSVVTTQNTFYTFLTPLQAGATYYWRVTAEDPEGNTR
ncbi:MAG: fibronectin type III domain-containing protein, partial [Spirochaetes bacterium]|nr:fibronectin type III domain-containing protein [Spirochaetota bacterium]